VLARIGRDDDSRVTLQGDRPESVTTPRLAVYRPEVPLNSSWSAT
jgi:hypothetical protein